MIYRYIISSDKLQIDYAFTNGFFWIAFPSHEGEFLADTWAAYVCEGGG